MEQEEEGVAEIAKHLIVGAVFLDDVDDVMNLAVQEAHHRAIFGPAGGGKSGLLRSINRMAELEGAESHTGDLRIDGVSVFDPATHLPTLRRRVGMITSGDQASTLRRLV